MSRYRGRHRPDNVQPVPYEQALSRHVNAVDRDGNRYTTHAFAQRGDLWFGSTILTSSTVAQLERDGLLPLREVFQ